MTSHQPDAGVAPVSTRALGALDETGTPGSASLGKAFRAGTERTCDPDATFQRIRPLMRELGITRIANLTGLDIVGVPVVAVHRPNSRSLSVSQGKGISLAAARVSGLMESIETHHAENVRSPLFLGSYHELRTRRRFARLDRLPRLTTSIFHPDLSTLWIAGTDLIEGSRLLVPYEMVHLDFRLPLPPGSGSFVMSSNGLASGNHLFEALSHAICELVERDANSVFQASGPAAQQRRALTLDSIDDDVCRALVERFHRADLLVGVWETTSDVGISSFSCTLVERDPQHASPVPPVSGSGCHLSRSVALARALTEAAQGRLTLISGSRDDLSSSRFERDQILAAGAQQRELIQAHAPTRRFAEAPECSKDGFDADVQWQLGRLANIGMHQVIAVNLTHPELAVPVVRVIIPGLETMSELPGYVPGARARAALGRG